jgi:hypothetical protein
MPEDSIAQRVETLPPMTTQAGFEEIKKRSHASLTPPEIFAKDSAGDVVKEIDMDATPRPLTVLAPTVQGRPMQLDPPSPSPL